MTPAPVVQDFGDRSLLVEPAACAAGFPTGWVLAARDALVAAFPDCWVVPGLASVVLTAPDPAARPTAAAVRGVLQGLEHAASRAPGRIHEFAVRYDGPDLAHAARLAGLLPDELVRRHLAATWTVAAVGFSPGFGYLTSDDPVFGQVPRRADPRRRVPAGSVALAGGMCAVYPSATPGGWQLIGTSDVSLFDPDAASPALLAAGDCVRFVAA